jgi:hypothetical protein
MRGGSTGGYYRRRGGSCSDSGSSRGSGSLHRWAYRWEWCRSAEEIRWWFVFVLVAVHEHGHEKRQDHGCSILEHAAECPA